MEIPKPQIKLDYEEPSWGECANIYNRYRFEVLKGGAIVKTMEFSHEKSFFTIGRLPICDFELDHESVSRYHAVIQFSDKEKQSMPFLYDLNSTHGTFLNKK